VAHTGEWVGRDRMAWSSWVLGATSWIIGGIVENSALITSGAALVSTVLLYMVGGKVLHDKFQEKTNARGSNW